MRRSPCAWLRLALWLALVLLLAACRPGSVVRSPTLTPVPGSVVANAAGGDAYLSNLAAAGTFRGSVLLARDGAVLLSKGYGLADEAGQFPNTPRTWAMATAGLSRRYPGSDSSITQAISMAFSPSMASTQRAAWM